MPAKTATRAYVGLALIGWGLSILIGVTPHEDPIVGVGLLVFGLGLTATSPTLPNIPRLPRAAVAITGLVLSMGMLAFTAFSRSPWDVPKVAILVFGSLLVASSPFLERKVPIRLRRTTHVPVATLVACLLPVVGAPLLVWGTQALLKGALGTTPLELMIHFGLLLPLYALLGLLGLGPHLNAQILTYDTPRGPLSLEVGAACSGIQAMALFAGILTLYLFAERPDGRRLATWSLIGLGGVYLANLLRLAMLFMVGYQWGPEALLRAHAQAGWIFFVAWALLFARLARGTTKSAGKTVAK